MLLKRKHSVDAGRQQHERRLILAQKGFDIVRLAVGSHQAPDDQLETGSIIVQADCDVSSRNCQLGSRVHAVLNADLMQMVSTL